MSALHDAAPWEDDAPEADRDGQPLTAEQVDDLLGAEAANDTSGAGATGALDRLVPDVGIDLLRLADPDARQAVVHALGAQVRSRLAQIAADARTHRGSTGRASSSHLLTEAVQLAAAAESLGAVGRVLTDGAREAAALLAEAMTEHLGDNRRSMKIADGYGGEVECSLTSATATSVDEARVLEVLGTATAARWSDEDFNGGSNGEPLAYARGARDGIAALRALLGATPGWKVTALAGLVRDLQRAGEGDLAARLDAAFARVERGEATPRIVVRYPDQDTTGGPR